MKTIIKTQDFPLHLTVEDAVKGLNFEPNTINKLFSNLPTMTSFFLINKILFKPLLHTCFEYILLFRESRSITVKKLIETPTLMGFSCLMGGEQQF